MVEIHFLIIYYAITERKNFGNVESSEWRWKFIAWRRLEYQFWTTSLNEYKKTIFISKLSDEKAHKQANKIYQTNQLRLINDVSISWKYDGALFEHMVLGYHEFLSMLGSNIPMVTVSER